VNGKVRCLSPHLRAQNNPTTKTVTIRSCKQTQTPPPVLGSSSTLPGLLAAGPTREDEREAVDLNSFASRQRNPGKSSSLLASKIGY